LSNNLIHKPQTYSLADEDIKIIARVVQGSKELLSYSTSD